MTSLGDDAAGPLLEAPVIDTPGDSVTAPARHPPGCSQFVTIVFLGVMGLIAPLGVVSELSTLDSMMPCNTQCIYYKRFDDGTPLKASFTSDRCGLYFLAITNGRNRTAVQRGGFWAPQDWQACDDDKLAERLPKAICPGRSIESMQRHCKSAAVKAHIVNVGDQLLSGYVFWWSCISWGMLRIVHDLLLLCNVREDITLPIGMFSGLALTSMAGASLMISVGNLELFYAPVGEDCGCFYQKEGISAMLLLAVPAGLVMAAQAKVADVLRGVIGGDYLIIMKYRLAFRQINASRANPTGSLLGIDGFRSHPPADETRYQPPPIWLRRAAFCFACSLLGLGPPVMLTLGMLIVHLLHVILRVLSCESDSISLRGWMMVLQGSQLLGVLMTFLLFFMPSHIDHLMWIIVRMKPAPLTELLTAHPLLRMLWISDKSVLRSLPELAWAWESS